MSDVEDFDSLPKPSEIESISMTIKAILDEKYYDQMATLKIYSAKLESLKKISNLIKKLNEILPIPSLQHLKRVKREGNDTYVILDTVPETEVEPPAKRLKLEESECIQELKSKGFHPEAYDISEIVISEVPRYGPKTRLQYNKSMEFWPVNFHPEKKLEKMMSEEVFNKDENKIHVDNMKYVIKEAIARRKNFSLVVDPSSKGYIAKGWDMSENHPLHHAVMVVVDAVAYTQEGGAWDLPFKDLTFDIFDFKKEEDDSAPYLCTGYDLYVFREPCVMCAMALVHSRIKRVFFHVKNANRGAFVSKCQIHTIKDLNHHYDVFQIDLAWS